MTFGSLFSGCGGADLGLERAGMTCLWSCEYDRQAKDVLRFNRPDVPIYPDVRTFPADEVEVPDLLWASPPCQDLSIAGQRKGLAGERSGLFFDTLGIVGKMRPAWMAMEQVPGLLSSNDGEDFLAVLEGMNELRYVLDCDIIDSQCFGVPQRRSRVYFLWQSIESIQKKRTLTSALTISQVLAETSLLTLIGLRPHLRSELPSLAFDATNAADGLQKRMRLFGLPSENRAWSDLLESWAEPSRTSPKGGGISDCLCGPRSRRESSTARATSSGRAYGSETLEADPRSCSSTAPSWLNTLDGLCAAASAFITSTETSETTESKIFTCALTLERTASLICRLSDSSQSSFHAASSALIALEAFTNYAKQTIGDLFAEVEWLQPWSDFAHRASGLQESLLDTRVRSWGEVLALAQGLRGDTPPSREKGQRVAASLTAGSHPGSNAPGRRREDDVNLTVHEVVGTLPANSGGGGWSSNANYAAAGLMIPFDTTQVTSVANRSNPRPGDPCHPLAAGAHAPAIAMDVAHTLRGEGFDASEDGTGRGTPLVPVYGLDADYNGNREMVNAMKANGQGAIRNGAVAFAWQAGGDGTSSGAFAEEFSPTLGCNQTMAVHEPAMAVRRLTPRECERLQSFNDDWTRWGRKEDGTVYEMADGPRYKLCGNAVTSNVAEWIAHNLTTQDRENTL